MKSLPLVLQLLQLQPTPHYGSPPSSLPPCPLHIDTLCKAKLQPAEGKVSGINAVLNVDIWFIMGFLHECPFFSKHCIRILYLDYCVFEHPLPLNVVSEVVPPFAHPAVPFLLTVLLERPWGPPWPHPGVC